MPGPGDVLVLEVEKAASGGRMLARHHGQVVLVGGAIPGERVRAVVERVASGVLFARTESVDEPSRDRRQEGPDPACGGNDYAHIAYPRQLALKQEIVRDAFVRIAKHPLEVPIVAHASPERGYRMRARLHVRDTSLGFYREGTHALCDAAATGQLTDASLNAIAGVGKALAAGAVETAVALEIVENVAGDQRVVLLHLGPDRREHGRWEGVLAGPDTTGAAISRGGRLLASRGDLKVHDPIGVPGAPGRVVRVARDIRGFFQGNRYLLQTLADRVLSQVPDGPLLDLYAGCGLFGLLHASAGRGIVEAVESEPWGAADLQANARAIDGEVRVHEMRVERFLQGAHGLDQSVVLVDPPRTGLSRDVCAALAGSHAPRIVYLSCDVATLARDVRRLLEGGYVVRSAEVLDLFPATSHVETLVVADRGRLED